MIIMLITIVVYELLPQQKRRLGNLSSLSNYVDATTLVDDSTTNSRIKVIRG
jgi:hypothetical protein